MLAFLLLIGAYIALQSVWVQNYLLHKTTAYLTAELKTKVEIQHIEIRLFDKIRAEGIIIQDLQHDTLLYADMVQVNLDMFALASRNLRIEDITINDAKIHLYKKETDSVFNHQFLIDYFTPKKDNSTKGKDLVISELKKITLQRINFRYEDARKGLILAAELPRIDVATKNVSSATQTLEIERLLLERPSVALTKLPHTEQPELLASVRSTARIDTIKKALPEQIAAFQNLQIKNGSFVFNNMMQQAIVLPQTIDFNHLNISNINIEMNDFSWREASLDGTITKMRAQEKSGFDLQQLKGKLHLTEGNIAFKQFRLETNASSIGDSIAIRFHKWADFADFAHRVNTTANFRNAEIAVSDVVRFIPNAKRNKFISKYLDDKIRLTGRINGNIDRVSAQGLRIGLGRTTELAGDLRLRDITDIEKVNITGNLEYLRTNMREIHDLLPETVQIPPKLDQLGNINFTGNCSGFLSDFVVAGELRTDIGRLKSDLRLVLDKGMKNLEYEGDIALSDFNLRAMTDNKNFGKASFTATVNGRGVDLDNLNARVKATVTEFFWKDKTYSNINIDGTFDRRQFQGSIVKHDDDLDLAIAGNVDLNKPELPQAKVTLNAKKLDLYTLNITKEHIAVSGAGEINFVGSKPDDIKGKLALSQIKVVRDGKTFELAYLNAESDITPDGRAIDLKSDVASGHLQGRFNFATLPDAFAEYFERNFPSFAKQLSIVPRRFDTLWTANRASYSVASHSSAQQNIKAQFNVVDTKNLLDFLRITTVQPIKNLHLNLDFDNIRNKLAGRINMDDPDSLTINNVALHDVDFNLYPQDSGSAVLAQMELSVQSTRIGKDVYIPPVNILANAEYDRINFGVHAPTIFPDITNLYANGTLSVENDFFKVHFDQALVKIYKQDWTVPSGNLIAFRADSIKTDNFKFQSGNQYVQLWQNKGKGLSLKTKNLRAGWISREIIKSKGLDFDGLINANFIADDLVNLKGMSVFGRVDSLSINGVRWGELSVAAKTNSLKDTLRINSGGTYLQDRKQNRVNVGGRVILPKSPLDVARLDLTATANKYPIEVAQMFLVDEISKVEGEFDANVHITGTSTLPHIEPESKITGRNVGVTINFLKIHVRAPAVAARLSDQIFDLSGTKLVDKYNNIAFLKGGITHDHFKNFGPNLSISAAKFLLLDTQQGDNSTFYGKGVCENVSIDISGLFGYTDMDIRATTDEQTRIVFPLREARDVGAVNFIKFVSPDSINIVKKKRVAVGSSQRAKVEPKGLNLLMTLNINPKAQFELVFDENTGEKMTSQGDGNITLDLRRIGEFAMRGKYTVKRGSYLFTYQSLINKPFDVQDGGTIVWDGAPYDADINLTAIYKNLRVAPFQILQEYTSNNNLSATARQSTEVALLMDLRGRLLKPDISFHVDMPNIDSRLKTYWETKKRILEEDPNEMNRQVFGLMVLQNFLPATGGLVSGGNGIATGGINTLTEVLSNQLSNYVNNILSDVIKNNGGGVLSSVNFAFNYKMYDATDALTNAGGTGTTGETSPAAAASGGGAFGQNSQVQVGLKNALFKDRLLVDIGGSVDIGSQNGQATSQTYFGGNFMMEYLITPDGRYRLRAYARPEQTIASTFQYRWGVGGSYRRDFDNLDEFLQGFRKELLLRKETKPQ